MGKPEAAITEAAKELFTIADLARKTALTYRSIHRYIQLGRIRVIRCAGSVRIPKAEVERVIEKGF